MPYRIYADESGTHSEEWLVIGMLFVPDHGPLHSALCNAKETAGYFNTSPKRSSRYKETHLAEFASARDVDVGKKWIDLFLSHDCYFRSVVIDWQIWDGSYFGDPFDPEALQKRRAYKKWAEMLIQPELTTPLGDPKIIYASFFLDRLRIMYGYDVLDHLEDRFKRNYLGESPYIKHFQHTDSWKDANQCLQLCDLLTGCVYQSLVPATRQWKRDIRAYLETSLGTHGIKNMSPGFWRQYAPNSLTKHFPKFTEWFWRPTEEGKKRRRRR